MVQLLMQGVSQGQARLCCGLQMSCPAVIRVAERHQTSYNLLAPTRNGFAPRHDCRITRNTFASCLYLVSTDCTARLFVRNGSDIALSLTEWIAIEPISKLGGRLDVACSR